MKRLTRRIVAPLCVGSSPTTRPIFFYLKTGNEGPWPADSFIWGYRQAVRQRTLTPLSVVRLHLPLPVIKSCSFPLQDFLRGNKSLSRPAASAPLVAGATTFPPRWEACHLILSRLRLPANQVPLPPQAGALWMLSYEAMSLQESIERFILSPGWGKVRRSRIRGSRAAANH